MHPQINDNECEKHAIAPKAYTQARQGCGAEASREDVAALCGAETLARWDRFATLRSDDRYHECPACQKLVLGDAQRPAMACDAPGCGAAFCFFQRTRLRAVPSTPGPCARGTCAARWPSAASRAAARSAARRQRRAAAATTCSASRAGRTGAGELAAGVRSGHTAVLSLLS